MAAASISFAILDKMVMISFISIVAALFLVILGAVIAFTPIALLSVLDLMDAWPKSSYSTGLL